MRKKSNEGFYSLNDILSKNADYNIVFGERSNGKTFAALKYGLEQYVSTGKQFAYIRRWREDLRGKRAESLFAGHVSTGLVSTLTKGAFNAVVHVSGKWFLSKFENGKHYPELTPFCFGFCLSETEHEKSSSYPNVTTIVFDEFITRRYYLPDEFMLFMNTLSTIIRRRNDIKIFMLGNTINQYCPYFAEMGLKHITAQEQGTIDIYKFGENGAVVAVEYCASTKHEKQSNKYFCFDNQNLQMITGGTWELNAYPRLPHKYAPKDVVLIFYIVFDEIILQGNVISVDNQYFAYIHAKTTPVKDRDDVLVYSLTPDGRPNYKRKLLSNASPAEAAIGKLFATDKVFYQSNEIGEIVRNYIITSAKSNII